MYDPDQRASDSGTGIDNAEGGFEDCPHCADGGDIFERGPLVGCNNCFGMWAPEAFVAEHEALDRTDSA